MALVKLHTVGEMADKVIHKLGFRFSHRIEVQGFTEGIWLIWNDLLRVDILMNNCQFLHTRFHWSEREPVVLLTAINRSP